jgi:hypothetical protein
MSSPSANFLYRASTRSNGQHSTTRRRKARIAAAHAALDPAAAQLGDILTAARSQAARLQEELAG